MSRTVRTPLVGVLCCNEVAGRDVQVVATRFVAPLVRIAGVTVLLVPAVPDAVDTRALAGVLDGLLLTGSRSNVAPARYRCDQAAQGTFDPARDEVALSLAGHMIEAGKPVFGICRGLQELNVLFGGTLAHGAEARGHHHGSWEAAHEALLAHRHDVMLAEGGVLAQMTGLRRVSVNSAHEQGIDRLGAGLSVEAVATHDALVEAISSRPCGGDVLAVQWHPEWDADCSPTSRAFFARFGQALGHRPDHHALHGLPATGRLAAMFHQPGPSHGVLRGH